MVVSLALDGSRRAVDVDVAFVDAAGCARRESLSACSGWTVPFETVLPVRRFGSHRGQRSFKGLWWSATIADHVGFESWLERDHVMAMDFDSAGRRVFLAAIPDYLGAQGQGPYAHA